MSEATNETVNPEVEPEVSESDRLKAELEFTQAELSAAKDKFLRLYADFDNFRKRTINDLDSARQSGEAKALRALLPTLDDIERALGFAKADPAQLIEGLNKVVENFRRNLASLGVQPVPGQGSDFDPRHHEAIAMVEGQEGKVMQVYQEGFKVGDVLIREAKVVVGTGAPSSTESN
jgi:molecular chaperone GrpE